jgi:Domain of Unknown Function (DUF1080)
MIVSQPSAVHPMLVIHSRSAQQKPLTRRGSQLISGAIALGLAACSSSAPSPAPAAGGTGNGGSAAVAGAGAAAGGSNVGAAGALSGGSGAGGVGAASGGSSAGGVGTSAGAPASAGAPSAGAGSGAGGAPSGGSPGAGAAGLGSAGATGGAPAAGDLFNGTDLTGFNVYKATTFANNAPGMLITGAAAQMIFKPENGMIHVYADLPDQSLQYHYLLQTVAAYGKYNLSWDYKWGTKKFQIDATGRGTDLTAFPRDAGVLWHIHGDRTQVWPSSIEFQNKWGSTGDIYALYAQCNSPGAAGNTTQFAEGGASVLVVGGLTQHARSADFETPGVGANAASGEGSDWNTCQLQVNGGTAVYTVNGHIVNRTTSVMDSSGKAVTSGYIAWQAEQAEVYYRNLRLQVLP